MMLNKNEAINNNNNNNNGQPKKSECSTYCSAIFYWVPMRSLCFVGAVMLFVFPFLDNKFSQQSVIQWFLGWYIQGFAILAMFIESPTWWLTKKVQLSILLCAFLTSNFWPCILLHFCCCHVIC